MDFLSSQSKSEKSCDKVRAILNKFHLALFTGSFFPPFIFDIWQFGVTCYCKKIN